MDRLAKLARQAARKSCLRVYGDWDPRDPNCLEALGHAQLQVVKIIRQHPEYEDAGIYTLTRKRTTEYLARRCERDSRFEDPQEKYKPAWTNGVVDSERPSPDVYAACDDETDRRIVDFLTAPVDRLTKDNVRRTAAALGLPYQNTRKRVGNLRYRHQPAEFTRRSEQTADPAILLKARDEYSRDPHGYRLARVYHYCCRNAADHHALTTFFDGKELSQEDRYRLPYIAYRFVEM